MNVEFLKRAESHVVFTSNQGTIVESAIKKSIDTGQRVNESIEVLATDSLGELIATFIMVVSVKVK